MPASPRLTGLKGKLNVQAIISNNKHALKAHLICRESAYQESYCGCGCMCGCVYLLCLTNRGK